jgi:predicted AlkP superfamily pyrophosphatase or phosphodiesterase
MRCAITAIIDGIRYETYQKLIKKGKLPFIEEISKESINIEKCYSVFPSATVSGHASISTGCFPAEHGLVGQSWFDREKKEFIGYDFELTLPDNWIDASTSLNDEHLIAKTGFEIVKELGIRTFSVDLIRKGADLKMSFITPGHDKGVAFSSRLFFLRRFASHRAVKRKSIIKKLILKFFPFHVLQHEIAVMNTLKAINTGCRFGVTWFMETDAASHLFGPDSLEGVEGKPFIYDSIEDAVRDADEELEKLYRKLSKSFEVVLAIVTDHGHSRLMKGRKYHVDLSEELENFGINAFSNIDPHEFEEKTGKKAEVVIASSGPRMAHVYVLDNSKYSAVFEALQCIESIEFIFFKRNGEVYMSDGKETMKIEEYEFGDEYPRAVERIRGLIFSERCGDFIVTARYGYEFQISDYKGAHGGLNFEDSTGFALVHSKGMKERRIEEGMITDVLPTVVNLLKARV